MKRSFAQTWQTIRQCGHTKHAKLLLLVSSFWILVYVWLISTQFVSDSQGLGTLLQTTWGDWAAHLIMTTRMAYGETVIPAQNPLLLGTDFIYPFGINLVSALLVRMGVPLLSAFIIPQVLSVAGAIFLITYSYQKLFSSNLVAALAITLLLTSGGLAYLTEDTLTPFATIQSTEVGQNMLTFDQNTNLVWGATGMTLLIPQRALSLGIVFGLLTLLLSYQICFTTQESSRKIRSAWIAGVLLLLLPYIHTHTFLAIGIIVCCLGVGLILVSKRTELLLLLKNSWPLLLLAILALLWHGTRYSQGTATGTISWQPGWYAESLKEWLVFWWNNWGIIPLAALAGWHQLYQKNTLETSKIGQKHAALLVPAAFFILFLLLNLISFQPHLWDNTKLLFWVAIGFCGLASYGFLALFESAKSSTHPLTRKITLSSIVIIICVSIFGGLHDTVKLLMISPDQSLRLYTTEEIELAQWVRQNTSPDSIWLAGERHNHWLSNLTGRQVLMSYSGWLWTHGLAYDDQQQDMLQLFANPARQDIIEKWQIQYAVLGEYELLLGANPAIFEQEYQEIYRTKSYKLYALH
ncbi:MAG: hypothetical protein WDZ94_00175 [Patescibacteria group bacterium]